MWMRRRDRVHLRRDRRRVVPVNLLGDTPEHRRQEHRRQTIGLLVTLVLLSPFIVAGEVWWWTRGRRTCGDRTRTMTGRKLA